MGVVPKFVVADVRKFLESLYDLLLDSVWGALQDSVWDPLFYPLEGSLRDEVAK